MGWLQVDRLSIITRGLGNALLGLFTLRSCFAMFPAIPLSISLDKINDKLIPLGFKDPGKSLNRFLLS